MCYIYNSSKFKLTEFFDDLHGIVGLFHPGVVVWCRVHGFEMGGRMLIDECTGHKLATNGTDVDGFRAVAF